MRRSGRLARQVYRHPVNRELLDNAPVAARIADRVTGNTASLKRVEGLDQRILELEQRIMEKLDRRPG